MRRLLWLAAVLFLLACMHVGYLHHQHARDVSSDGRYHKCGLVTEQGVTEYLNVYQDRCGR